MTDLLLRPEDTGEIPTGVGEHTANLAPYAGGLPPAFRRPTAVLTLIEGRGCRTVVPNDEDFVRPGQPVAPAPEPTPAPKPTVDDRALADGEDVVWSYAPAPRHIGRHRRPSRWDWLTVPVAMAVQRIGRAM